MATNEEYNYLMKTILVILFFISQASFGSSNTMIRKSLDGDSMKWVKLGYEVARAHAPDYEIAGHITFEKCGDNTEVWSPNKSLGETWKDAPASFDKINYYEGNAVLTVFYKCTRQG